MTARLPDSRAIGRTLVALAVLMVLLVLLVLLVPALGRPAVAVPTEGPGQPAPAPTSAAPDSLPAGRAVWPLHPRPDVVAGFDAPASPWGPGHRGVDLRGTAGQAVLAARGGTVSFAGRIAGRGVVVVDHGATRTTYEPVVASVDVGDRVVAGSRIGTLEQFGSHCAPAVCLHWGLRAGERYLDPLTLLGAGPVRLLPLGGPTPWAPAGDEAALVPQLPGWRPIGSPG